MSEDEDLVALVAGDLFVPVEKLRGSLARRGLSLVAAAEEDRPWVSWHEPFEGPASALWSGEWTLTRPDTLETLLMDVTRAVAGVLAASAPLRLLLLDGPKSADIQEQTGRVVASYQASLHQGAPEPGGLSLVLAWPDVVSADPHLGWTHFRLLGQDGVCHIQGARSEIVLRGDPEQFGEAVPPLAARTAALLLLANPG